MHISTIIKLLLIWSIFIAYLPGAYSQTLTSSDTKAQKRIEKDISPFVQVEVNTDVYNLINSWDKRIWIFTSKDNPIKSFDNLKQKDMAGFGMELFQKISDLSKVLGLKELPIRIIAPGIAFPDAKNSHRLYITWSEFESNLPQAIRIKVRKKEAE